MAEIPAAEITALQKQLLSVSELPQALHRESSTRELTQESLRHQPVRTNAPDDNSNLEHPRDNRTHDGDKLPSEVAETQDGVDAQAQAQPPQLTSANSEPAPANAVMADNSPTDQTRLMTTFHGLAGGDTQPFDTQVYKQYIEQPAVTPAKPITVIESTTGGKSLDNDDDEHTNLGTFNVGQGDSYMDLGNLWPEEHSPSARTAASVADDMEDLLASPQTQMPPLPKHVTFPETPQLAGHKRKSDGEAVTSAARSDGLSAFEGLFGPAKTPNMSTTQLFHHTQARSSPPPDGVRSDPLLTRPSPNMQETNILTSHPGYSSSPELNRDEMRGPDELRSTYVSMRESQARRAQSRAALSDVLEQDDEDEDVYVYRQKQLRRVASDHACRNITAPQRPSSSSAIMDRRHTAFAPSVGDSSSPVKRHTIQRYKQDAVIVEDDDSESPEVLDDVDETMEENDQYDELGQAVLKSQVEPEHEVEQNNEAVAVVPQSQEASQRSSKIFHTTQPTSLAQSQVVPQSEKRSLLAPVQYDQSSNNIIPGSQSASQHHTRLSHSVERPLTDVHSQDQVPSSPQEAGQSPQRVPSSPPLPHIVNEATPRIHSDAGPEAAHRQRQATPSKFNSRNSSKLRSEPGVNVNDEETAETGSGRMYATAHSHSSPQRPSHGNSIQGSVPTPLKAAGAMLYTDIMGMPSQPSLGRVVSADLNIDAVMDGVMTEDDRQYMQIMASPTAANPRKRRRLVHTIQSSTSEVAQPLSAGRASGSTYHAAEVEHDASLQGYDEEAAQDADEQDTPASTRQREAAGAATVDDLLFRRSPEDLFPKLSGPGKRTYKDRSKRGNTRKVVADTPAIARHKDKNDHLIAEPNSQPVTTPLRPPITTDSIIVSHPHRVFAFFKGQYAKYYPAIHRTQDGHEHAQFDDGTMIEIRNDEMLPLDLRIGDVIKIDLPHMRTDWTIEAFEAEDPAKDSQHRTDIYGHAAIRVRAKSNKLKGTPAVAANPDGTYSISVANIYLTPPMLGAYRGREMPKVTSGQPSTPVPAEMTTSTNTPQSRSGRKVARRTNYAPSSSATIETPVSIGAGVFSDMAFAITLQAEDGDLKKDLFRMIQKNGGIVLDTGFDELFEHLQHGELQEELKIKPKYQSLTFVALIADKHCRTVKYMQALALGLPALSTRWITDSIKHRKTADLLPWARYLLPAGDSAFLGTTRSRTLPLYQTGEARLADTIANRDLLLDGAKVLLEMPTKSRTGATYDRRKSYAFLATAMGAAHVRGVVDLNRAYATVLDDKSWNWICVDGDIDATVHDLLSNEAKAASKKRKKADATDQSKLVVKSKDGDLTVVGDEFIVQSLILGALAE